MDAALGLRIGYPVLELLLAAADAIPPVSKIVRDASAPPTIAAAADAPPLDAVDPLVAAVVPLVVVLFRLSPQLLLSLLFLLLPPLFLLSSLLFTASLLLLPSLFFLASLIYLLLFHSQAFSLLKLTSPLFVPQLGLLQLHLLFPPLSSLLSL